jgi:hypothetical protein
MIKKRANTHSTIKLKSLDRQPNPTEKEAAHLIVATPTE